MTNLGSQPGHPGLRKKACHGSRGLGLPSSRAHYQVGAAGGLGWGQRTLSLKKWDESMGEEKANPALNELVEICWALPIIPNTTPMPSKG